MDSAEVLRQGGQSGRRGELKTRGLIFPFYREIIIFTLQSSLDSLKELGNCNQKLIVCPPQK